MKSLYVLLVLFGLLAVAHGDDHVIARVLDREILLSEKDELNGVIFGTLLEQFAKDNNIAPTPADLDAHIKRLNQLQAENHQKDLKARAAVVEELKANNLAEADRKSLEEKLSMYDLFVKTEKEMRDYDTRYPEESRKSEEAIATSFVQAWKVNQALHRKYGGRVIFQQAGPEPLDAYRDFLREQEKAGAFTIIDTSYEAGFWNYFTNDAMHTFYSKDEGDQSMETPWWLMEKPLGE